LIASLISRPDTFLETKNVRSPPSLSKNPNGPRPMSAVIDDITHLVRW